MRGKNLFGIALIVMICTPLVFVGLILAQPKPIGQTVQENPFDSNPTAHTSVNVTVTSPDRAYDGSVTTLAEFKYGYDGYFNLSAFNNTPPTPFTISWVDIKVSYKAGGAYYSDDMYRIVCYVAPHPDPVVLQDWLSGEDALYDPEAGGQGHRAWGNVTEPNDGVWTWSDVGSVRVVIETDDGPNGYDDFVKMSVYEVWLTIYSGPPPPEGISVQPSPVLDVPAGEIFFVDVYVRNVTKLLGYQLTLCFDNNTVRAKSYLSYGPFNSKWPSKINPNNVTVAYSSYSGDQEGLTGSGPLTRIYFDVLADGSSLLDIDEASLVLSDVNGDPIVPDVTDGLFANVYVRDVAVSQVVVKKPTQVMPGENVTIDVTVVNQGGTVAETFDVTVKYDTTPIAPTSTKPVTSLAPGTYKTLSFTWDTTGVTVQASPYQIKVEASTVPDETDTGDNVFPRAGLEDGKVLVGKHDIAIANITRASPTNVTTPEIQVLNVTHGELVYINVTMLNNGTFPETFNVTAQFESTFGTRNIGTKPVSSLAAGANTTLTFTWNTTVVQFRVTLSPQGKWVYANNTLCTIKANATEVPYEKKVSDYDYTGDNTFTDGKVNVFRSRKPEADFEIGYAGEYALQGKTVTFTATKSYTPEHTEIISYEWDYGDETSEIYVGENLTSYTTHIYTDVGKFDVTLVVENNETLSDSITKSLTVHSIDIAIVSVTPSATEVAAGESLNITVTVENQGTFHWEDLNVTTYYDNTEIGTQKVTNLKNGTSTMLTFTWNTTEVSPGIYTIMANATPLLPETVTGELDKADNELIDGTVTILWHDIAVSSVTASPTEVTVGESVSVSVTVENQGDFTETFTVTAYANETQIGDPQSGDLALGASTTLTFTWDTTDFSLGNYTMKAVASTVSGEIDTADNTRTGDTVTVKAEEVSGVPTSILLYAVAGVAMAIATAVVLLYFFKYRKPKEA